MNYDKWLTTLPHDYFADFCQEVCEAMTESFYEENESWVMESAQMDKWLDKLYFDDIAPKKAAAIIERAHKLYRL